MGRVKGSEKNTGRVKGSKNKEVKMSPEVKEIVMDIVNLEVGKLMMLQEHKLEGTLISVAKKHGKQRQYINAIKNKYGDFIDKETKRILNELYSKI